MARTLPRIRMEITPDKELRHVFPPRRRRLRLLRWRLGLTVMVVWLFSMPMWAYLTARFFLSPDSFLSEALLLGVAAFVLGSIQLIMWAVMAVFLLAIWCFNPRRW